MAEEMDDDIWLAEEAEIEADLAAEDDKIDQMYEDHLDTAWENHCKLQAEAYLDEVLDESFNPFLPRLSEAEELRQIQESWEEREAEDF
jgi:hypothetical protein